MLVVQLLRQEGPMSFGQLQKKTALSPNDLNHILGSLRNIDLIIQNEEDKKYYLTNYCVIVLDALRHLKETLMGLNGKNLLSCVEDKKYM